MATDGRLAERCVVKACAFPAARDGLCATHLRDRDEFGQIARFPAPSPPPAPVVPDNPSGNGARALSLKERKALAREMLKRGESMRSVVDKAKLSNNTVLRIRDQLGSELPQSCSCGRPAGHRGWCPKRVERSPARQKTLAKLHKREGRVPSTSELRTWLEERKAKAIAEIETIEKRLAMLDEIAEIADEFKAERQGR